MEKREWTPEEVAGEAQRARDTGLYIEAEHNGRKAAFHEAAAMAEEEVAENGTIMDAYEFARRLRSKAEEK